MSKPRKEQIGIVRVVEEATASGNYRIRTYAQRKAVPKPMQKKTHVDWAAARAFAVSLNEQFEKGRDLANEATDETRVAIKQALELVHNSSVTESHSFEPLKTVELGLEFQKTLVAINEQRTKLSLDYLVPEVAFDSWKRHEFKQASKAMAYAFSGYIQKYLDHKTSANGGVGNKPLERVTKKEIKRNLTLLKGWVGELPLGTPRKDLRKQIVAHINSAKVAAGRTKGNPWSQQTKKICASNINGFGRWLVKEEHCEANPFSGLTGEFAGKQNKRVTTLTVRQVKKIFEVAARPENRRIVPYLALLFFSGARSEELAHQLEKSRKLDWSQFDGWCHRGETKGPLFFVPAFDEKRRRSKISTDRYAELTPNGVAWIRWAFEGKLPKNGEVVWSRRTLDRVKANAKVTDVWYEASVPRHCFFSYARSNPSFKKVTEAYWCERAGHDAKTFRAYYKEMDPDFRTTS